jgi:hypothetical protein
MSHDAKLRKGKWLVPYVSLLDNWESKLNDVSEEGLFEARKIAPVPSSASLRTAQRTLLKLRLQPAEVAAVILPHAIRHAVLRLLPRAWVRRLAEGRAGAK